MQTSTKKLTALCTIAGLAVACYASVSSAAIPSFDVRTANKILHLNAGQQAKQAPAQRADEDAAMAAMKEAAAIRDGQGGGGLPEAPPANDDCAGAIPAVDGVNAFDLLDASHTVPAVLACGDFPFGNDEINNDIWFTYTATCTGTLFVDTCGAATRDTRLAVHAGAACPPAGAPLECNDDNGNTTEADTGFACATTCCEASLSLPVTLGDTYTIRVGTFTTTTPPTSDPDSLNVACFGPAVCGDGILHPSEVCDDGNLVDGDGCDSNCTVTACGNGIVTSPETCDDSGETAACNADCTISACGDGVLNATAGEACDDGNLIDGDGCSSACALEAGCVHTVDLIDLYGDGWDGASMDVLVNGSVVLTGIAAVGSGQTESFTADTADVITTVYTSGSFENEHVYNIFDGSGNLIGTDGPFPSAGVTADGNCPCDHTVDLIDLYGDGWDGAFMDVLVNGTNVLTGITAAGTGSTFTFSAAIGDAITTVYTSGSFENEHVYNILDGSGNIIGTDGPFPTAGIAATGACPCDHTVDLIDLYGDGWDGAFMDVLVNGSTVLTAITATGAGDTFAFSAQTGDTITTVYTSGSFENEHVYTIFDGFGNVIGSDGPFPSAGISATGNCGGDPSGACCAGGACTVEADEATCLALAGGTGVFFGAGTDCTGVVCTEACCTGGACTDEVPGACAGMAFGLGTECSSTVCPSADSCVDGPSIGDGVTMFNTAGATDDPADPVACDSNLMEDVWFQYTATCEGLLTIETCGAANDGPDTVMEVYDGCVCPPDGTTPTVACPDDSGCGTGGFSTFAQISTLPGNCYNIRLSGWNGGAITGELTIGCAPFTGACCQAGACTEETAPDCATLGGVYQGNLTTCDSPDCNGNGINDACDIDNGAADCQSDGIPDECQLGGNCPNQAPNQANASFSDLDCDFCGGGIQLMAEDFNLYADEQVDSLSWWGIYFNPDEPTTPDNFTIAFYDDVAGLPGTLISSVSGVDAVRVATGNVLFGVNEYMYTYDLAPDQALSGPGTFWVEIYNDTTLGPNDPSWVWETGDVDAANGIANAVFSTVAPPEVWTPTATDLAFVLNCVPALADCNADGVPDSCQTTCGDGVLDVGCGETCDDGNNVDGDCCSSTCQLESNGSVCGAAAGDCDLDDVCVNGTCIVIFAPDTTECRPSAGICDVADFCTGSAANCPADAFQPTTTECRADAGDCDVPDFCDGAGNCDADAFEATGTNCGDGPTLCSGQDTCDGAGTCNPNHDATTVECRADAGECDVADFCDGAGNCDADAFEPFGTDCGAGPTECSDQDTCDGAGGCTNANDVAAGTPCGDGSDTDCDNPDSCDGGGGCLDNFESSATVCRESVDECDPEETCDGSGACPSDFIIKTAIDDDGCCPPGLTILSDNDCPDLSIPTVSQWGMITLSGLLVVGLWIKFGRRDTASA